MVCNIRKSRQECSTYTCSSVTVFCSRFGFMNRQTPVCFICSRPFGSASDFLPSAGCLVTVCRSCWLCTEVTELLRAEPRSAARSTAEDGLEQFYLVLTDAVRARALESAHGIPRSNAWSTRAASRAATASSAPSALSAAGSAGPSSRVWNRSSSSVHGRSRSPLRRRELSLRSAGMWRRRISRYDPQSESRAVGAAA